MVKNSTIIVLHMVVGTTEKTKITFSDDFGHGHFILLVCVNNEH